MKSPAKPVPPMFPTNASWGPANLVDSTPEELRFGGWLGLAKRLAVFLAAGIAPVIVYAENFHNWLNGYTTELWLTVAAIFVLALAIGWICELLLRAGTSWGVAVVVHFMATLLGLGLLKFGGAALRMVSEAGDPRGAIVLALLSLVGGMLFAVSNLMILGPASYFAIRFAVGSMYDKNPSPMMAGGNGEAPHAGKMARV